MNLVDTIVKHNNGIIGTLAIHMLLFVWFNIDNMSFTVIDPKEKVVAVMDFQDEESFIEVEANPFENANEKNIENVVANNALKENSYTSTFDQKAADQEVLEELKKLEADEFENISLDNPELIENSAIINSQLINEDADKNAAAEFGKNTIATASYELLNRTALFKKIPSYQCKEQGIVRLNIKVNQKGKVVFQEIDESKTSTNNQCLRAAALNYIKNWRFNQDFNDLPKKTGWVEFTYLKQ